MSRLSDIRLESGDIAAYACDAVVNDSNIHLFFGGGVNDAILRLGGETIQEACDAIGEIRIGTAVHTPGGNLSAKYVIHAAATSIGCTARGRDVRDATRAALAIAEELGVSSIAFPPLGSSMGYIPVTQAGLWMLPILAQHLESGGSVTSISLVVTDDAMLEELREAVRELQAGPVESDEEDPKPAEADARTE